ncbi:MAG: tyrosine--tRNA ligase [Candidatus Paceibacterota bacterium]|jgi:tyrosyl-tRNA synthetase
MEKGKDLSKIDEVLSQRVEEVLPKKEGLKKLMQERKIRVYLGVDPTGKNLHLGHTIPLRKLQEFADLGHEAILVMGTGTVLAGDPSQRESARPKILEKEIKENIKTWKKQVSNILDFSKVKIRQNGEWLLKLKLKDIIDIASNVSAVRLFQRDMFQKRISSGNTVWLHEVLYPVLQGYDSVFMDVDLEVGGSDQVFNMLVGRELQQKIRKKEKYVLTCPMILGTDGKTMSKTSGNCIWINDSPKDKFGKVMSVPDDLIISYFKNLTNVSLGRISQHKKDLQTGRNPKEVKKELAFEIVKTYNSQREAEEARREFEKIFEEKQAPSEMAEFSFQEKKMNILDLLVKTKMAFSKGEAKRLVVQGGVRIRENTWTDWKGEVELTPGVVINVGKRKFAKIK